MRDNVLGSRPKRTQKSEAILNVFDHVDQQDKVKMFRNIAQVTKPIAQVLGLASVREREGVSRDFEAAAPRLRQRQTYSANYFTRTASDFRDRTWRKGIALENLNHLLRLPRRILHMPARMLPNVRAICVNAGHNAGTFTGR